MDSRSRAARNAIVGCAALVVMWPLSALWWGFVATKLWLWFVQPFGVPAISLWPAVGLGITLKLFCSHLPQYRRVPEETTSERVGEGVARAVLVPAFALLFGWIAKVLA